MNHFMYRVGSTRYLNGYVQRMTWFGWRNVTICEDWLDGVWIVNRLVGVEKRK